MQFSWALVIVLVLVIVLEFQFPQQIEHEHEHEHDYEVASTSGLPTFPARERPMAPRRSAHLVLH